MTKKIKTAGYDPKPQVDGMMALMTETYERLQAKRFKHAELKIAFERSQEKANLCARDRMMAISSSPELINSVDPRTGKTNEEWRKWMMESMLERDQEFIEAISKHNETQADMLCSESELLNLTEKMGTLRTQAILLSSLLRFEAAAAEE